VMAITKGRFRPTGQVQRMGGHATAAEGRPNSVSHNRPACDGWHIRFSSTHLAYVAVVNGGCDMVADWILMWLLFLTPTAIADAEPKGASNDRLRK
jgi:hypothetical protein